MRDGGQMGPDRAKACANATRCGPAPHQQGAFEVWMPNRGFEEPRPLAVLLACAAGDVMAVRSFAETLLRSQDLRDPAFRDARLIMTAACLQLQSRAAPAPTVVDLLHVLASFESGLDAGSILGASPMQFVQ